MYVPRPRGRKIEVYEDDDGGGGGFDSLDLVIKDGNFIKHGI